MVIPLPGAAVGDDVPHRVDLSVTYDHCNRTTARVRLGLCHFRHSSRRIQRKSTVRRHGLFLPNGRNGCVVKKVIDHRTPRSRALDSLPRQFGYIQNADSTLVAMSHADRLAVGTHAKENIFLQ